MKSQRRAKTATTRTTAQEQPQMTTPSTEIGRIAQLRPDILKHFEANPGKTIYFADLAKLRPDASKSGIQNATRELTKVAPIEIITAGQAWRYRADWPWPPVPTSAAPAPTQPAPPADEVVIFRQVGKLSNGALILEDEDGRTYKAVEI